MYLKHALRSSCSLRSCLSSRYSSRISYSVFTPRRPGVTVLSASHASCSNAARVAGNHDTARSSCRNAITRCYTSPSCTLRSMPYLATSQGYYVVKLDGPFGAVKILN